MTNVAPGSESLIFRSQQAVVDHVLRKILANTNRYIGTEWEMFFVNPQGNPITRADGQKAFTELRRVFGLIGYKTEFFFEEDVQNNTKIVGLKIDGLGTIVPEAGHQFEFASTVSRDCDEILEKNEEAYRVICDVCQAINYEPVFRGHMPGYAGKTEGMDRSRGTQWRSYYHNRFGDRALSVREAQDGTASIQVTIDSGADKFHEFFQALLLIEPALAIHYTNSRRSHIGMETYGQLIPSQVEPIVNVWNAKSPAEALTIIIGRLMEIEVPFSPDPDHSDLYKNEPLINGKPPTVLDLMNQGRLSEKMLNNVGGFFYTRPALKNFSLALLEMRGVDSQPTPEAVMEVARRVETLLYNDFERKRLLNDYAFLSSYDVGKLHKASAMVNKNEALNMSVANMKVSDFVRDIVNRSEPAVEKQRFISERIA